MKKIIIFVLSLAFVSVNVFVAFEGSFALADVSSTAPINNPGDSTSLGWDLTLNLGTEISLICQDTSVMAFGNIGGVGGSGGNVDLARWCKVVTNDLSGWKLDIKVTNTPAFQTMSGPTQTFPDYATMTPSAWVVVSSSAYFGFSASSTMATSGFSNVWNGHYRGFGQTSDITVAQSASSTDANGVRTDFNFRVYIGPDAIPYPGNYVAHVVVTAVGN